MADNDGMNDGKGCCFVGASHLMWWMMLVVAVLAVPSLALIVTSIIPMSGLGQVVVFVLACWACTYLGMRLMRHPKMADFIDNKKD